MPVVLPECWIYPLLFLGRGFGAYCDMVALAGALSISIDANNSWLLQRETQLSHADSRLTEHLVH